MGMSESKMEIINKYEGKIVISQLINQATTILIGGIWTDKDGKIHYVGLGINKHGDITPNFPSKEVLVSDIAQVGIKMDAISGDKNKEPPLDSQKLSLKIPITKLVIEPQEPYLSDIISWEKGNLWELNELPNDKQEIIITLANVFKMANKKVSKEEFDKFISEYPNKLEVDVAGMFEPPLRTWNDFKKADKWPESTVAFCKMYDGSDYHFGKQPEYYICED